MKYLLAVVEAKTTQEYSDYDIDSSDPAYGIKGRSRNRKYYWLLAVDGAGNFLPLTQTKNKSTKRVTPTQRGLTTGPRDQNNKTIQCEGWYKASIYRPTEVEWGRSDDDKHSDTCFIWQGLLVIKTHAYEFNVSELKNHRDLSSFIFWMQLLWILQGRMTRQPESQSRHPQARWEAVIDIYLPKLFFGEKSRQNSRPA